VLACFLTVRSSLGVRHLGDLCFDWWLVEQHFSPRSADVALAYRVSEWNKNGGLQCDPLDGKALPSHESDGAPPPRPGNCSCPPAGRSCVCVCVSVRARFSCSLIVEFEGSGWVGGLWAFGASSSTVRCHGAAQPEGMKERGSGRRGTVEA